MAKIVIDGMVKELYTSDKAGNKQYLTVLDRDGGEIKLSLGDNHVDQKDVQRLTPIKITATVEGYTGKFGQQLTVLQWTPTK